MNTSHPRYKATGHFMLRAPALPFPVDRRDSTQPPAATADLADVARWVGADPERELALRLASPSLASTLHRAAAGDPPSGSRADRCWRSVRRYGIRMSTRPTPFGLFAGIAFGAFAENSTARLGERAVGRIRLQPDLGWTASLIDHLLASPSAVDLPTKPNPFIYHVGERLIVASSDVLGRDRTNVVDLRRTEAVEIALDGARKGRTRRELLSDLTGRYPEVPETTVQELMDKLFENGVIVPALMPSLTPDRGLEGVCEMISTIPGYSAERDLLVELDRAVRAVSSAPELAAQLDGLVERQVGLVPQHPRDTLAVDAALDLHGGTLSSAVGAAAAEAADLLTRVGSDRARAQHLVDFEHALIERYGILTDVPLLELLSPELGLEAPDSYDFPARTYRLAGSGHARAPERDIYLNDLLDRARHAEDFTLELTDEILEKLAALTTTDRAPHPGLDVYGSVCAESTDAIDRGDFRFVVLAGSLAESGRSFGRFDGLFPAQAERTPHPRREEIADSSARTVELRYVAQNARYSNVARSSLRHDLELALNCEPVLHADHQVHLQDILVGTTGDQLYLRWAKTGEKLVFVQTNMLNHHLAQNAVRFLLDVSGDSFAPLTTFEWGAAESLRRLPRVTRGRIVLAPARWKIQRAQLKEGPSARITLDSVRDWRKTWGAPRHVYLTVSDNRLLLDLESTDDLLLLDEDLRPDSPSLDLQEVLPAHDELWLRDAAGARYSSEIVVPVELSEAPATSGERGNTVTPRSVSTTHLPGADWVSLEVSGSMSQLDRFVGLELGPELQALQEEDPESTWFFVRYSEPDHHVRIRFLPTDPGRNGAVLDHLMSWVRALADRGLVRSLRVVPFSPEVGRYGGESAYTSVLPVFNACSLNAVRLARLRLSGEVTLPADVLAAWMLRELYSACGALDDHPLSAHPSTEQRTRFRTVSRTLTSLCAPTVVGPDAATVATLDGTADTLARLLDEAARFARTVRDLETRGMASSPLSSILPAIAHMMLNRTMEFAESVEGDGYALWTLADRGLRRRAGLLTPDLVAIT